MKKIYLFPLLLLLLGSCKPKSVETNHELSVMSFNIRMETKDDSLNWWGYRKEAVKPFLREQMPDIIGAQEVLYNQLVDLTTMLPDYKHIGAGREDGNNAGEFSPLLYNTKRLKLLGSGWFWLSETPEEPSKGWDAACERIATWGIFEFVEDRKHVKDRKLVENRKKIAVLNTHFDHVGEVARANSSEMIKNWVNGINDSIPVIVLGDFNADPASSVVSSLTSDLKDSYLETEDKEGAEWSFHDFGQLPMEERPRIDYIFYKGAIKPLSYTCFDQPEDGEKNFWLSDHAPILTLFEIE